MQKRTFSRWGLIGFLALTSANLTLAGVSRLGTPPQQPAPVVQPAPAGANPFVGVDPEHLSTSAAQLQKMLSNPAVQGYLRFFSSPTFASGAEAIVSHPNRSMLIWVEVIWVLLMFVVRSWRLSRLSTSNWGQVLWVNLSHFFLLWGGTAIVIPWVLFGEPYRQVLWGLWAALRG